MDMFDSVLWLIFDWLDGDGGGLAFGSDAD